MHFHPSSYSVRCLSLANYCIVIIVNVLGDTVVCHISQMTSPYWKPEGPVYSAKKNVYIPQLREKGGKRYSLFTGIFWTGAGNCIFAANRMIEFARDING